MINMAKKWERSEAIVAQRISVSQIGGFTGKKIRLSEGETAILEKDGDALQTFDEGKHKVSGMFSGSDMNVVFVDKNAKVIRRSVQNLWTKDDKKINAAVEMTFTVKEPEKLRRLMLGKRDILSIEDIWTELKNEVSSKGIEPVIKGKNIDDILAKNKTDSEMRVAVEVEAKKKFEIFGLDLMSFSVDFVLPEDYEDYLKRRGDMKEVTEKEHISEEEEVRKAVHERDVEEIKGSAETREKAIDDMEQERIKREAEMNIEEEETQQDMKDAVEALKLKELKDRQKDDRDVDRKRLGLETLKQVAPGSDKKLEEKYETLKKVIEETEKKFLNRKIEKDTFRKLMDDYGKEKTELEVKMKKKGG
jgi:hypothetical protein